MISVFVQLTIAGVNVGPFTITALPSSTTLASGVSRGDLITGQTYSVPDNTITIRVESTGVCESYINLELYTTTTTTTTATPVTTTTTTAIVGTTTSTTTEYVPVEYWNTQQSGYFCKNDCEPPLYGTCLFYTVVAHTYSSWVSQQDANNQALADIDLNGQTWVNENATCQADPPPTTTTTTTSSTTTSTTTEVPPTTTTTTTEPGTTTTTTTGEPGTTTTTTTGEPGTTTTTTTEACIPANGTLTFVESGSDDTTYRGTFTIDISPTTYGIDVYPGFSHDYPLESCGAGNIAIEILAGQTSGTLGCYWIKDVSPFEVTYHYDYSLYGGQACLTVSDLSFEVPAATAPPTTTTTTTEEPATTTTTTTEEPEVTTTTTTTEDPGYVSLGVKLGIAWPGVCSEAEVTRYSSTVFGVGITLYTDTGLTTPVTGYGIVVDYGGSKSTYNLNSLTGVVGSAEGNTCA